MNNIYRIFKGKSTQSCNIGYLLSEDESDYLFRVQQNENTFNKKFEKNNYRIESIYEDNGNETYSLVRKNSRGERVNVDLSKPCYGG